MRRFIPVAAFTLLLAAVPRIGHAESAAAPVTDCDRLAATTTDPDNVGGHHVELGQIKSAEAVAACTQALARYPDSRRLMFQLGRAHDAGRNAGESYRWYLKSAKLGSPAAQYNLAVSYQDGEGVAQDYEQAVFWYGKSAAQGDADSQRNLGVLYYNGEGVEQDFDKAFKLFMQAAEKNDTLAQYDVGLSYREGNGVERDFGKAAIWLRKAADGGEVDAQRSLGELYEHGLGVGQDLAEALAWYRKAAAQGDAAAAAAVEDLRSQEP